MELEDVGSYKTMCEYHDPAALDWVCRNWAKYLVAKTWFVCEPCYLKNLAADVLKNQSPAPLLHRSGTTE